MAGTWAFASTNGWLAPEAACSEKNALAAKTTNYDMTLAIARAVANVQVTGAPVPAVAAPAVAAVMAPTFPTGTT